MSFHRTMPILQVRDVRASETFYQKLGFASLVIWEFEGEANFCIVCRDHVTIGLQLLRARIPVNTHWAAYIYVADVEALHAEYSNLNLPQITDVRRDNPYDCEDFDVVDIDGHRLAFGQDFSPGSKGPGM